MPKIINWDKIKQDYLSSDATMAELALKHGVSKRAIEQRAADDGWKAMKKGLEGQDYQKLKEEAKFKRRLKVKRAAEDGIDEVEIVTTTIISLHQLVADMTSGDGPVDTRGIGGVAGALVKMLEYRRRINPPGLEDLVEQVIAMGYSPEDFVHELAAMWSKQSA